MLNFIEKTIQHKSFVLYSGTLNIDSIFDSCVSCAKQFIIRVLIL